MLVTIDTKDARIEFKTSKDIKLLLQEAANALGMDLSSFLISTATQRAKDIMLEDKILTLARSEWEDFETMHKTKNKPTSELKALMNLEGFNA